MHRCRILYMYKFILETQNVSNGGVAKVPTDVVMPPVYTACRSQDTANGYRLFIAINSMTMTSDIHTCPCSSTLSATLVHDRVRTIKS